jgi:hypothetical protein
VACMGEKSIKSSDEKKSERKKSRATRIHKWYGTIKNDLEGTGRDIVDWIYFAQDMDHRRAVVNMVTIFRLS